MRDARLAKQWTVEALARKAGVSRDLVYAVERGEPSSLEALARLAAALGLRLEVDLMDPRRTREPPNKWSDPVHSAMGEFEAAHLRPFGIKVGMAEPYQHFQFAGRGDLVAWDMPGGAFLHIENRTRFPNFQETAGSFNAKRAYLAPAIAERLGVRRWSCQTHVLAALWSSETLHVLRLRPESFRALCPDPSSVFGDWWSGSPPRAGTASTLVVIDPLATSRRRTFVGLEEALDGARPRFRGYADAAMRLAAG